jgi:hypothetical protein
MFDVIRMEINNLEIFLTYWVIGGTDAPSTTCGLLYLYTFNSLSFKLYRSHEMTCLSRLTSLYQLEPNHNIGISQFLYHVYYTII